MNQKIKSFAKFIIGTPLTLVSFFLIAKLILSSSSEIFVSMFSMNWTLIFLSFMSLVGYFFLRSFAWGKLLELHGHKISTEEALYKFSYSETKRYLPANIFAFFARAKEFQELGVPPKRTAKLLVLEALLLVFTSMIIGWLGIAVIGKSARTTFDLINTYSFTSVEIILYSVIGVAILLSLTPLFFLRKKLPVFIRFFLRHSDIVALYILAWAVFGLGNYFFVSAFSYIDPVHIISLSSYFVLSWLIGYLSFVAPMGLGVREALLTAGLSTVLPLSTAATLSVALRVILIFSEIGFLAFSYALCLLKKRGINILKKISSPQSALLTLFITLYIGYFSFASFEKHLNFFTGRFDLGNMDQTVWNTLHGQIFMLTNPDATNVISRLAIHADFILILLAPFYLIWQDPRMLLFIQSLILGLGAFFVYKISFHVLRRKTLSLVLALSFLLNPMVQKQNLYDFHAVTLATTFLLGAFYYITLWKQESQKKVFTKNSLLFFVFLILSILTKENIYLIASFFGLYLIFLGKKKIGIAVFFGSLLALYFIVTKFIPGARGGSHFALEYFNDFGASPFEIIRTLVTNPIKTVTVMFAAENFDYFIKLIMPVAGLSLFSPLYLFFSLPDIAINLLSKNANLRSINFHYAAAIIPFVYISSIYGLHNILNIKHRFITEKLLIYILLFSSIYSTWKYGVLPGAKNPSIEIYNERIVNREEIQDYVSHIPKKESVAATNNIGAHLTHREKLYTIPYGIQDSDVVVFLLTDAFAQPSLEDQNRMVENLRSDPRYTVAVDEYPFIVFQRRLVLSSE